MTRWDGCAESREDIIATLVDRPPIAIGEETRSRRAWTRISTPAVAARRRQGRDRKIQTDERDEPASRRSRSATTGCSATSSRSRTRNSHLVPADYQRRQTLTGRALRDAGAQGVRGERADRGRANRRRASASCSSAAETDRARRSGDFSAPRASSPSSTCLRRSPKWRRAKDTCGRTMTDEFDLEIIGGRHPVVERMMPRDKFIPNDVRLTDDARVIILTGPNMAGKSTILRQIGLIVLMAQIGSFVPAARATIGIVDRVFTRVGASDNLVRGQSTFMVEMAETSAILHTATRRSLVLLDEIGRGTSTYDGVSIAWAVSEHLHDEVGVQDDIRDALSRADAAGGRISRSLRNYNVAVREVGDQSRCSSIACSRAARTVRMASRSAGWRDCRRR